MIIQELKEINSSPQEIWKFSYIVGIVLLGISGYLFFKQNPSAVFFLTFGALLILIGYFIPTLLLPLHKIWMGLAVVLGFISSHLILSILYYLVITPLGITARLFGQDFLKTKKRSTQTYWIIKPPHEGGKERYTKQF